METFEKLIEKVKQIPYGRNSNREDFNLVIIENKGTCSSKHAFLKEFATKNNISNVKLFIGVFKMNEENTPKIYPLLTQNNLKYIPEAHCYLKINEKPLDATNNESLYDKIVEDLIEEIEIEPFQVVQFKINYHKEFLKNWILQTNQNYTIEQFWEIREKCIEKLAQ